MTNSRPPLVNHVTTEADDGRFTVQVTITRGLWNDTARDVRARAADVPADIRAALRAWLDTVEEASA
jgi:hypothetical protein